MRGLAILIVVLAVSPASPAPDAGLRTTYFGESLLSRCELVVRAEVVSRAVLAGGMTLTTFRVRETLLGRAPRGRLVLGSPDPAYHGETGRELVLFLVRETGKTERGWRTLERFASDDDEGASRLAMARAYIRCEAPESVEERVRLTRDLHLANITGDDGWARANAIRELTWFTRRWADSFDRAERDRLFAVREKLRDRGLREMLTASLHRIDAARRRSDGRSPRRVRPDREAAYVAALESVRTTPAGPRRAERLEALARARPARVGVDLPAFLDDAASEVRRVAAHHLGETLHTGGAGALLRVLEREKEDVDVRREAIRSLGILKHAGAIEAIAGVLEVPTSELAEVAIMALARIGGPEAKAALAACDDRLTGDDERVVAVRRTLRFAGSPGFARQEAILARIRRARLAADR